MKDTFKGLIITTMKMNDDNINQQLFSEKTNPHFKNNQHCRYQ